MGRAERECSAPDGWQPIPPSPPPACAFALRRLRRGASPQRLGEGGRSFCPQFPGDIRVRPAGPGPGLGDIRPCRPGRGGDILRVRSTGHVKTFREAYCERHGIAPDQFERLLVWRSLHWPARPFFWLHRHARDYWSPDFEFVRAVGELRSRRGYHNAAAEFHYHPKNRGLLRIGLRVRVSSRRLQAIFEREIHQTVTNPPFGAAPNPDR